MQRKEHKINLAKGFCHFLPQHLVISEFGNANDVLRKKDKNSFPNKRRFFLLLALVFAGLAFAQWFNDGSTDRIIFNAIPALIFWVLSLRMKNKTDQCVIERSKIVDVKFIPYKNNPHFLIILKEGKKNLQRKIEMDPGYPERMQEAVQSFKQAKLFLPGNKSESIANATATLSQPNSPNSSKPKTQQNGPVVSHHKQLDAKRDKNGYLKTYK